MTFSLKKRKKLHHLDSTARQNSVVDGSTSSGMNSFLGYLIYVLSQDQNWMSNQRIDDQKNWLFSTSEKSAQAKGIILSIILTVVENGLDKKKYLIYLKIFTDENIIKFL
ncbi:hypothetical protein JZO77_21640 [Enterococcus hulanensis]|uniref:hypothetical protein n=1 Tax=Enterococcus hulanensis TaxID=2559929 RepID=UPI001A8DAFA0|nr:hypothetical protein [Enterococcus hulanensis]MBO0459343.1 hypothetical protein [Enterococcus hulanensis]